MQAIKIKIFELQLGVIKLVTSVINRLKIVLTTSLSAKLPMGDWLWNWRHSKDLKLEQLFATKYQAIIAKYQTAQLTATIPKQPRIWLIWMQGEEAMPYVVAKSYQAILRYRGNFEVVLLTEENMHEYIEIPVEISRQIDAETFQIAHLTDYLRYALLAQYGGVWLDLTMYVNAPIPPLSPAYEFVYNKGLVRFQEDYYFPNIYDFQITYLAMHKNALLANFMRDMVYAYLVDGKVYDYFATYALAMTGFKHIPALAAQYAAAPQINEQSERFSNRDERVMLAGLEEDLSTFAYKFTSEWWNEDNFPAMATKIDAAGEIKAAKTGD
ncbi:MAG: capsular polysaccharide synthesis protein [Lactobacillaceae bacterium]|jgi:hypothetical protein|nr:capsular polysaccharide synthesis protein [Lactobacillaceae bacterium]